MIKVGIVGVTGYTGEELIKILSVHPKVEITGLYGRKSSVGKKLEIIYPNIKSTNLVVEKFNIKNITEKSDVVFLALPHGVALNIVPDILDKGIKVIDLSADYRLTNPIKYEQWYNTPHTSKSYISKAVYGLPELNYEDIKKTSLIANPGCYPTSVILGCIPAIINNLIDLSNIIIDSKSGISGAGRKNAEEYYDNEHPNFKAYKLAGQHRHIPEIEQELEIISGINNIVLSFSPHIIPMERGMLSTIYFDMKKRIEESSIIDIYKNFYKKNFFIKIFENPILPNVKDVLHTNFCELGIKVDKRTNKLIIVSIIDNLVKGASGQAVQNMNIMFGLEEYIGLV
ncbi:MAG: N-acetyl-gamma-glutamyl-phosphate reductase [Endomicrobium sp.]|jgi:N-acetyl-gamma-glutamyl-phosphate reductase|nr:N-acetyl-gamma-glutamyl-phosphate reductase [Endomicrobium sp.]